MLHMPLIEPLLRPPLSTALVICAASSAACWLLSVLTRNCSQVDRLWSLLPPVYVTLFASAAGFADPRLNLMTALCWAWGLRLTYNFARKGGYRRGAEDYRWPILRQRMSPTAFHIFNATFIAPYQNLLLLLLALPAYLALRHRAPLSLLDAVAALGFVGYLIGEAVADQQQWRFQEDKRQRAARGDTSRPFLTEGLFRYSRHPNFFCEQMIWWSFYLFSVAAGAGGWSIGLLGPVLLTLLFQGSTSFTEMLSLEKYPDYADYQASTSRLIPWPPRSGPALPVL